MVEIGEGIVFEGIDYICFGKTTLDGKNYLYLVTADEPFRIRFAELATHNGKEKICLIGDRDTKLRLLADFQSKTAQKE